MEETQNRTVNASVTRSAPSLSATDGRRYVSARNAARRPSDAAALAPLLLDGIAGVVLEANDLAATRAFYEPIFQHADGRWVVTRRSLRFVASDNQRVEFSRRARPRTLAHAGLHVAYRVPRDRVNPLVSVLEAAGHAVSWWQEDHPGEGTPMPYLTDPSGNIIQLVPSGEDGALIDHFYLPVEDIEYAELYYLEALNGTLDSYFGFRTLDVVSARAQSGENVPYAPWTRTSFVSFRTHKPNFTPAAQIFARYGSGYVGVALTGQRLPEPPEGELRHAPRVILQSSQSPEEVEAYLAGVRISAVALKYDGGTIPFEREGSAFYLRDRSGNFVEIDCLPRE